MSLPSAPLNHCPAPLVPIILEVIAAHNSAMPSAGEGIHEKKIEIAGRFEFRSLLCLLTNPLGAPSPAIIHKKE